MKSIRELMELRKSQYDADWTYTTCSAAWAFPATSITSQTSTAPPSCAPFTTCTARSHRWKWSLPSWTPRPAKPKAS